jgi:hypothetical protein
VRKIKQREAAGNWTFVYLGADQDAWSIAGDLGFAPGNVMAYASAATSDVFSELAVATASASSSTAMQTRSFFSGN